MAKCVSTDTEVQLEDLQNCVHLASKLDNSSLTISTSDNGWSHITTGPVQIQPEVIHWYSDNVVTKSEPSQVIVNALDRIVAKLDHISKEYLDNKLKDELEELVDSINEFRRENEKNEK